MQQLRSRLFRYSPLWRSYANPGRSLRSHPGLGFLFIGIFGVRGVGTSQNYEYMGII